MNAFQRAALRLAGLDTKTVAFLRESWLGEQPAYSAPSFATNVREGYRKNELIFACIVITADTAAQIEMQVVRPDGQADPEHPLKRLIQAPNPYMSEYDFWAAVISYQYLAGRAVFEIESSRAGQPVALWPLRPDWVRIIPGQDTPVKAYTFGPPGGSAPVTLAPEQVLDFPLFDPYNQYRGQPPVSVAGRVGDVDNSTTDFIKLFFERGGIPPGYLKTTQTVVNKADADRVRNDWTETYGGFRNWTKIGLLSAGAEYQKAGFTFQEMGFEVLDARNEARTCMVLRVPPIIVGAKVGLDAATYSNYETAEKAWWRNRLLPLYKSFEDVIQNRLLARFGGQGRLHWDTSQVYALQEDLQRRWQRATDAAGRGLITRNEFRLEVGLSPVPDGNVYLVPIAAVETPARSTAKALTAGTDHETKTAEHAPDRAQRTAAEQAMAVDLETFFQAQRARITQEAGEGAH